jgi:outer membrane protein assembly factor BamB
MMRLRFIFVTIAVIASGCSAIAADWPQFRGINADAKAPDSGINKDWNTRPPAELWRFPLSDSGYTGPSVAGGMVFIIDHEGSEDIVRALDLGTGEPVWEFRYEDAQKHSHGFSHATPTWHEGLLYTVSKLGRVHCLDVKTGQPAWERPLSLVDDFGGEQPRWGHASAAIIDGDRLILFPGGQHTLLAVDRLTGKRVIWKSELAEGVGYGTPALASINGVRQLVTVTDTSAVGIDAGTGKTLWRVPWETRHGNNPATPIITGNHVYVTSGYGHGCGWIEVPADGEARLVWENRVMMSHFNTPVLHNGHIFGTGDSAGLMCLDPTSGEQLWQAPNTGHKGGVVFVDDTIICLYDTAGDLIMAAADPTVYTELGRIPGLLADGGNCWAPPVISDGKLLIRNQNVLVCLDLM